MLKLVLTINNNPYFKLQVINALKMHVLKVGTQSYLTRGSAVHVFLR